MFIKKFYIPFLLLYFTGILTQGCQPGVSRDTTDEVKDSSAAAKAAREKIREAVLSSAETRRMADELDDYVRHKLGPHFNGAFLVARKGVVIYEHYQGYSNIADKIPIDKHSTFQLASTSKPFTAMGILWLQQEGKLNVNDPIQKFFPRFPYQGVTLKTLLNHRSGLPNYLYFGDNLWPDRSKLMSNMDVINLMIKHHPAAQYAPDRHYSYCNTNYCILGAVIEKVTGEKLGTFLRKTFFDPLGMHDTYVYTPQKDAPRQGQSLTYDYRSIPIADECYDGVTGDKNVYSTPEDLLKWDQALYNGKLFTNATLEAAYTPYSNEHPGIKNYGLGWHLLVYPNHNEVVYHNGWWHGNNSVFYRFIQDTTTLIVLSNRYNRAVYQVQPIWKILHEAPGVADDGED